MNALAKRNEDSLTVRYETDGGEVKLSPAIIKKYLVNGQGNVTDQETMMFLQLCRFQKLNPFLREAHLIKYGNSPATIVTGKEVFTKRASKQKTFDGFEAGIIVLIENKLDYREGTFYLPSEKVVGGWATVYRKDWAKPVRAVVSMDEYIGRKKDGEINSQWRGKPATMIRKVALIQALREAYPRDCEGLYDASEVGIDENRLNAAPVDVEKEPAPVVTAPEERQTEPENRAKTKKSDDVEDAEFADVEQQSQPETDVQDKAPQQGKAIESPADDDDLW